MLKTNYGREILVDPEDYIWAKKYSWSLNSSCYVSGGPGLLHRIIMNPGGLEVDHINGNKLDNRKINLRLVTHSQNHFNMKKRADNTSGIKGVVWRKDTKTWQAQIMVEGRNYHLGTTSDFFIACCLRKSAERSHHVLG